MGSTLRRLRYYYCTNVRGSKLALGVVVTIAVYLLFGRNRQPTNIARYKNEDIDYPMNDDEIKRYLEALQDTRPSRCRDLPYDFTRLDEEAPGESVSILMDFHGEDFYNLKLAISSVVEHTPFDLYNEVVVLDDGTTDMNIRRHAAAFLKDAKFSKARLYRSETFDGQAATRFKASMIASGTILVYVSSNAVVSDGWLQPLIARIVDNPTQIVVPHVDNFLSEVRFFRIDDNLVNVFTWGLSTVYMEAPNKVVGEMLDTPVMRGDVLAVKKSFLTSIGNFDEGLRGVTERVLISSSLSVAGHHLELSLRAWMCGGAVRVALCSRAAVQAALRPQHVTSDVNYRRITQLWYGEEFRGVAFRQGHGIDEKLTDDESRSLRDRRTYLSKEVRVLPKCKTFGWYLNNVVSSVLAPSDAMRYYGKLQAVKANLCLRISETSTGNTLDMTICRVHIYEPSMMFEMNSDGAIFNGDRCLAAGEDGADDSSTQLTLTTCQEDNGRQKWRYSDSQLTPVMSPSTCLTQLSDRDPTSLELVYSAALHGCSEQFASKQTWQFVNY